MHRTLLIVGLFAMVSVSSAAQGRPVLTLTPDLRIDATANDLSPIQYVETFPNGTIVAAQQDDHLLRFFSPDGKLLTTFGRSGSGPGEFGTLGWLHGVVGDTLWTFDASQQRYHLITATGKLVRTMRTNTLRLAPDRGIPGTASWSLIGLDGRGGILALTWLPRGYHLPMPSAKVLGGALRVVLRADEQGTVHQAVASVPEDSVYCPERLMPECPRPRTASTGNGDVFLVVTTDVSGPHRGSFLATAIGAMGDTIFSKRYPYQAVPYPVRVADSVRTSRVKSSRSPQRAAYWRKVPFPKVYQPVTSVFVGHDRSIWIGFHASDHGIPWLVLNPDGSVYGSLTVPANVWVETADRSTLWATEKDEDDVDSIVRYSLRRG